MTVFLTSSPTGPLDGSRRVDGLDEKNFFADNLRRRWKSPSRCLIVAADPEEFSGNDRMADFFAGALERSGLSCCAFDVWDERHGAASKETLSGYDVIFLGGGHVPTQNRFFAQIGLKEAVDGFPGVVIGISAGSMNSAGEVYAQPELEGEGTDPRYCRWLSGLGLTWVQLLPHYQMVKDNRLDGKRLFEELTYADSWGHSFLAIPDGSYLLIEDGRTVLWGEGWRISDGELAQICRENETLEL